MNIPDELKEDIFEQKCLLFIGAGLSLNAKLPAGKTMPDWNALIEPLKKSLRTKEEDKLKIALMYENKFGRTKLIEKINSLLHPEAKPGKVHKKLAKIQEFDTIYTTNFDNLLEQAFSQETSLVHTIVGDKQIVIYSPRTHVNIIKMHGDIPRFEEIIFTEEDYKNYLKKHPVLSTHLSSMFATRTPLFIGYSLSDPHLNHIRQILKKRLGKFERKPYIVTFDVSDEEKKKLEKEGFYVIDLSTKSKSREKCLLDLLCEIFDFVNSRTVSESLKEDQSLEKKKPGKSVKIQPQEIEDESFYAGKIVRSMVDLEVALRSTLEKTGINKQDLQKPFPHIVNQAFRIGLLSPSEVNQIQRVRDIRNAVSHTAKSVTKNEMLYVYDIAQTIIPRLGKIKPQTVKIGITLKLKQDKFKGDGPIKISGHVDATIGKIPVSLVIINPDNQIAHVGQVPIKHNWFNWTISPGGPLWSKSGIYEIRAVYGNETNRDTRTFEYEREFDFSKQKTRYSFPIASKDGQIFDVSYLLRGAYLHAGKIDYDLSSLILQIESYAKGELWIKIPRQLLDAKKNDKDTNFVVLIDGEEIRFDEKFNESIRELIIPFREGVNEIGIIGTTLGTVTEKSITILKGSSTPRDDEKYLKPQTMIVEKGTTVTWNNVDIAAHTITSGTPETGPDGIFDSSMMMSGRHFTHTFNKPGTYRYFCMLHPWKEGKIIVTK